MTLGSFTCTRFVGTPTEESTTTLGQGKSLQILLDKALLSGSHSITQPHKWGALKVALGSVHLASPQAVKHIAAADVPAVHAVVGMV